MALRQFKPGERYYRQFRPRAEVEYMLHFYPTLYATDLDRLRDRLFIAGVCDTLRWLLGEVPRSVILDKRLDDFNNVAHAAGREAYAATEAMYDGGLSNGREGIHARTAQGVESAAMWAEGADTLTISPDWPFPEEVPEFRAEEWPISGRLSN